jgi:5'-3' exonuclease
MEQRSRRKAKSKPRKNAKRQTAMDSLQVTPGCSLMLKIKRALEHFACSRLQSRMFKDVQFVISGADVAGEGELKIIKYIKAIRDENPETDRYLLIGSDADLVLLGSFFAKPFRVLCLLYLIT